jgi:CRISPR-associated protein Cmr3
MFEHLITLEPLGLLYGSAGSFLSPENLVGRSGAKFPPSAVTLAGLIAAAYRKEAPELKTLQIAGPFWAFSANPQNFCVPTPLNCLAKLNPASEPDGIKRGTVEETLTWQNRDWHPQTSGKYAKDTWLPIDQWHDPKAAAVYASPWEFLPHLHPRLKPEERKVVNPNSEQGSLFLENAVQLHPDICLVYLSNLKVEPGWYRFGGESHLVDLNCIPLGNPAKSLLNQPLGKAFALITPALWGSNRLSTRYPDGWNLQTILTERPSPFRYRLGGENKIKRLSRGRYAVPAGSIYITTEEQPPWHEWQDELFPTEGPSMNSWGCGLSLPLLNAIT